MLAPTSEVTDGDHSSRAGSSLQEIGEQLLHDFGLIDRWTLWPASSISSTPRLGQLLPEVTRRLWTVVCGLVPTDDRQNRNPGRCDPLQIAIAAHRPRPRFSVTERHLEMYSATNELLHDGSPRLLAK